NPAGPMVLPHSSATEVQDHWNMLRITSLSRASSVVSSALAGRPALLHAHAESMIVAPSAAAVRRIMLLGERAVVVVCSIAYSCSSLRARIPGLSSGPEEDCKSLHIPCSLDRRP